MDQPAHLLVVDDDEDIRFLLSEFFGGVGYRVTAVSSGAALREAVTAGGIDLVLLDMSLPDESGLALAGAVLAPGGIPFVFVTGKDDTAERDEGLAAGALDYVVKPFNLAALLEMVQSALG